jgi:hypothetical protein
MVRMGAIRAKQTVAGRGVFPVPIAPMRPMPSPKREYSDAPANIPTRIPPAPALIVAGATDDEEPPSGLCPIQQP